MSVDVVTVEHLSRREKLETVRTTESHNCHFFVVAILEADFSETVVSRENNKTVLRNLEQSDYYVSSLYFRRSHLHLSIAELHEVKLHDFPVFLVDDALMLRNEDHRR